MSAVVTKTTKDGRLISTSDENLDKLKLDNSNTIGDNYLQDFEKCYSNLDVSILSDKKLINFGEKVNKLAERITNEIIKRSI